MTREDLEMHPRYVKIETDKLCCKQSMEFVLFHSDHKLRRHAVKHMTKTDEYEVWEKIVSRELDARCLRDKLKEIGCPYFSGLVKCEFLPCCGCRIFDKCTSIINDLESEYIAATHKCLINALQEPRYAEFIDFDQNRLFTCIIPGPVVIRGELMSDVDIYNLNTSFVPISCFSGAKIKFSEYIENEKSRIPDRYGLRLKTVDWCDRETWKIPDSGTKEYRRR